MKRWFLVAAALFLLGSLFTFTFTQSQAETALSPKEQLGMKLYFDEDLSEPSGQACASCHDPNFGFVDPDSELPVSEGVIPGMFGGRNSPSAAYAMFSPIFHFDETEGLWIGGQFWDGRATGAVLGDPLADQALGPFLNPVEMHNFDKAQVIYDVVMSDYADLFEEVWGEGALENVEQAYDQVALSIAAFERTELFAPFTSKYDAYLQLCLADGGAMDDCAKGVGKIAAKAGKKIFTKEEWYGLELFMGENNNDGVLVKGEGAMCAACHVADWTVDPGNVSVPDWAPDGWVPPVFTDFSFDNLGVPQNTEYPLLADAPPDLGLGAIVGDANENGKFKVMSLRNIGLTAPYGHNGYFDSLKEITHFYNTRDVPGSRPHNMDWPMPEYPATINMDELGNLGLSDADEDALVEFMKTLTDGWMP
ncbi:cytochrome-c peroxidase [bacterium]|nr:cytochrome-c peroxidase [bacterium]MCB2178953.1 cytochrome-c peroxidase [bacterium]